MRKGVLDVAAQKRVKERFLKLLAEDGIVGLAARSAGMTSTTAYRYRAEDPAFALAWDHAVEIACDLLEKEAIRRATRGTTKPIFHNGEKVGEVKEHSDTLLIFLLKGNRPKKFRDKATINVSIGDVDAAIEAGLAKLGTGSETQAPGEDSGTPELQPGDETAFEPE